MPRPRTTVKGFPCAPRECYDSRHLDGSLYKVYSVMKGFARAGRTSLYGKDSTRPLLFTASIKPRLCNAVCISKNQTYLLVKKLAELGWIVLREEGTRKRDGSLTPDTWEVLEHEEYVAAYPGNCPDYEYPQSFEAAQAAGVKYGQRLREGGTVPENFFTKILNTPATRALGAALDQLSEEDREEIIAHWKTRTADDFMPFSLPVANNRARQESDQSLTLGTGPVPNDGDCQSLSLESAGPYHQDAPVPTDRTDQSLKLGKNLSIASVISPITATTTPTTMAAPTARPWLTWLWSSADKERADHEQYKSLKLRKAVLAEDNSVRVSPDIFAIEELIRQHGENFVILAWACFAVTPEPHCKPPSAGENATLYPVTVFLKHFDSYLSDGKAEYERFKAEKASGGERYSEVIWNIMHYNEAHPRQK
jgi:hypothetical protein